MSAIGASSESTQSFKVEKFSYIGDVVVPVSRCNPMSGGIKKWFMFQMWRIQQVAAVMTIGLLALNLSLQLYTFLDWRTGFFSTPYSAVPILLLLIIAFIWIISMIWDLRLKMWREQIAVTIERNPYVKEKLYSKEIMIYALTWLPIMDHFGKDDPNIREAAEAFRAWFKNQTDQDKALQGELESLLKILGPDHREFIDWKK